MNFNDARKKLSDNPELAKSLKEAIDRNANAEELSGILSDAGIDSEVVESLVAEYQRTRGLALSDEDLDEDMLRMVAGGGCGKCSEAADCDNMFKNSKYWDVERCSMFHYCDQMSSDPSCSESFMK